MYTDGVSEAMNDRGEEFGVERLERALRSCAGASARETNEAVLRDIGEFTRDTRQSDDITFLTLHRKAEKR